MKLTPPTTKLVQVTVDDDDHETKFKTNDPQLSTKINELLVECTEIDKEHGKIMYNLAWLAQRMNVRLSDLRLALQPNQPKEFMSSLGSRSFSHVAQTLKHLKKKHQSI